MSTPGTVSQDSDASKNGAPGSQTFTLKVFGAEIPLPRWAVSILAVFVVLFAPAFLFVGVRHLMDDNKTNQQNNQKIEELQLQNKTLNDALTSASIRIEDVQHADSLREDIKNLTETKEKLADDVAEATKHQKDRSDWVQGGENARLMVTHYPSDGCLRIVRRGPGWNTLWWNKDPGSQTPAPGPVDGSISGELTTPRDAAPHSTRGAASVSFAPSRMLGRVQRVALNLSSSSRLQAENAPEEATAHFRCLDPHPGKFRSWNGKTQGCWRQVWREWPDRCAQYQWFNACANAWDADASGNPRVYWTVCNH